MTPRFVLSSDQLAQWTGVQRGRRVLRLNHLIDAKFGIIIMDVEASRHPPSRGRRGQDHDRTHRRFALKLERLAGATAYGSGT